jgi:hypothetical protein
VVVLYIHDAYVAVLAEGTEPLAQVTAAVGTGGVLIPNLPAPLGSTKDELP